MLGLTIDPQVPSSVALLEVPEAPASDGSVLVQALDVGVCGTDLEIAQGLYGAPPPGQKRLVLGHESLGRVLDAAPGTGFEPGELVVGIVRRPDPEPCENCAAGEWDMCRNGKYTEHGIQELDGFCRERFRIAPESLVRVHEAIRDVAVLVEPMSVVTKAWEHIEAIGARAVFRPQRVLVTGAGPIGLLAALLGVRRGLEVHVYDRVVSGPKPELVRDLGATYHGGDLEAAAAGSDVIIECTGVPQLVFEAMQKTRRGGIVCLTGVSKGGRELSVDMGALNRNLVLENDVVFGSVNANRRHYEAAVDVMMAGDRGWLSRLITRRVPLSRWPEAFERRPDDVKTVIELAEGGSARANGTPDQRPHQEPPAGDPPLTPGSPLKAFGLAQLELA
jgi:threonine dehydrogenase-like Zn-dependent dehydrogenase